MKTLSLLFCILCITINCQAQKYGFVTSMQAEQVSPGVLKYRVSSVIDLSKLPCQSVSNKNSYGTNKNLVAIYSECSMKWFISYLSGKGLKAETAYTISYIQSANQYTNCTYGNEPSCFMTKEEASKERQKRIDHIVQGHNLVEEID